MNLSDFFVADTSEVATINIESSPLEHFAGFSAKGVEIVKILTLLSLVDGSDVMANIGKMDSYFIQQSDEGIWIVAVPAEIVDHLAVASNARIESLAGKWAATEEWQLDGGTVEEVQWILNEMAKLSIAATNKKQNLYLWICL